MRGIILRRGRNGTGKKRRRVRSREKRALANLDDHRKSQIEPRGTFSELRVDSGRLQIQSQRKDEKVRSRTEKTAESEDRKRS